MTPGDDSSGDRESHRAAPQPTARVFPADAAGRLRAACEATARNEPEPARRPLCLQLDEDGQITAVGGSVGLRAAPDDAPARVGSGCVTSINASQGRLLAIDLLAAGVTSLLLPRGVAATTVGAVVADALARRWPSPDEIVLVGWGRGAPPVPGIVNLGSVGEALARRAERRALVTLVALGPQAIASGDALERLVALALAPAGRTTALLLSGMHPAARLIVAVAGSPPAGTVLEAFLPARAALPWQAVAAGRGGSARPTTAPLRAPSAARSSPHVTQAVTSADRLVAALGGNAAPGGDPAGGPIEVGVLGPVTVSGADLSFERRPTLTELVAYLALHPAGATTASWSTAVWPERRVPVQTVANRLSEARRALGEASDGLPRLRRHADRHLVVEVATDWRRFAMLADSDDPGSWRAALGLVHGRPFANLRSGHWTVIEGLESEIVAAIAACARRLGEQLLAGADPDGASWAAHQGLRAAPWDERLHRILMRAADATGDRGGVEAVLRQLAMRLEIDGDPLSAVHPQTAALFRRLTAASPL